MFVPALTSVVLLNSSQKFHHETLTIPATLLTAFVRCVWQKKKQNFSYLFLCNCCVWITVFSAMHEWWCAYAGNSWWYPYSIYGGLQQAKNDETKQMTAKWKIRVKSGGCSALYQLAIQAICFSYEWLKDKCAEYLMTMLTRCMLGLGNNNACSVECVCRKQSCKWTRLLTIFSKFYFPTVMEKNGNLSLSVYMQCMWELWMNRNITSSLTKKQLIAQGIN